MRVCARMPLSLTPTDAADLNITTVLLHGECEGCVPVGCRLRLSCRLAGRSDCIVTVWPFLSSADMPTRVIAELAALSFVVTSAVVFAASKQRSGRLAFLQYVIVYIAIFVIFCIPTVSVPHCHASHSHAFPVLSAGNGT